jgi:hypothetical protein
VLWQQLQVLVDCQDCSHYPIASSSHSIVKSRKRCDTHDLISRRILVCTKPGLTTHCSASHEIPTFLSVGVFVCVLCASAVFAQNAINLKCLNQLRFLGKHQHKHIRTQRTNTSLTLADPNTATRFSWYIIVYILKKVLCESKRGCDWVCSCKHLRLTATCCHYKDDLHVVYGCTYFHPCSVKQLRGP